MAKRLQDTQLTKDHYDAPDDSGGRDRPVESATPATAEAMKKRTIKQPKSRFQGATTPQPVSQSSFLFGNNAISTTPATPAPTANGSSLGLSFGSTPATPAPKLGFAGLNGGTPATPSQLSPIKSANPFASLNSTTPVGKPPAGMFGTTTPFGSTTPAGMPATPAGQPIFGGSTIKFPAPEVTKDQTSNSLLAKPTFGSVSEFNFPPAAKKDEASEAAKPKPTFGGVSTFNFPEPVVNDGDTGKSKPTFGGVSTFNTPEPVAQNGSGTGKSQPTFGVSASGIFTQKDGLQKAAEREPANPYAGTFGSTPAATPTKPSAASSTTAPVAGALFGNLSSTAGAGLFGSEAKIGETKKVDGGIFGNSTSGSSAPAAGIFGNKPEEFRPVSGGIFGAKAPISLSEVNYPALPPASTTSSALSATTNGNTALIQFNQVPPPSEDLTEAQREEFDRQYKVRTLNSTFVHALQDVDVNTTDLRVVFREYERLYEHIMHGTKRKDESQANGTAFSPKRSKTDEPKPAAISAASVFGAIVDKNIGQPAALAAKESQPRPVFGGFNSQPEKPTVASSTFGNSFATPPVATNPNSTTAPKATSMLFGAGGGAAVSAPAPSGGGLFSNLKPILRDQKDKGEEDSPEKPKSGGLLFDVKPSDAPPVFIFQTASTVTPEKPSPGFTFATPRTEGDQTWKPDTPIKFGGSSSGVFGSQSSMSTSASQILNLDSQETAASTAPSDAPKPLFPFTSNTSLSQNVSFDEITNSGVSTLGATSDTSAPASTTDAGDSKSNEPSDEVHADKVDMSGPGPGEENDEVLHSVRVAVYIKDDKGTMKKIAVGTSRVLKDKNTLKTRFLVRTEQGKVTVNVRLLKEVQYTPVPDKKVILIPDFSSGQKPKVYTVRTKHSSAVAELGRIIAEVKG